MLIDEIVDSFEAPRSIQCCRDEGHRQISIKHPSRNDRQGRLQAGTASPQWCNRLKKRHPESIQSTPGAGVCNFAQARMGRLI